jgi:hypothetical protein
MEQPAGTVTDTEPTSGTQAAEGGGITIYVNPSTMPTMSTADTALAESLKAKNPGVVTDNNKATIARTCNLARTRYSQAAGNAAPACDSLPVFLQGNDLRGPAENQMSAMRREPRWLVLNRRIAPANPGWYRDRAEPSPGCLYAERHPVNARCDEYPFWGTLQAYGGVPSGGTLGGPQVPGIRWVARAQNERQGGLLGAFYSSCGVVAQGSADVTPLPESTYLSIGIAPAKLIPSARICNAG